jgi:hypothetical protein
MTGVTVIVGLGIGAAIGPAIMCGIYGIGMAGPGGLSMGRDAAFLGGIIMGGLTPMAAAAMFLHWFSSSCKTSRRDCVKCSKARRSPMPAMARQLPLKVARENKSTHISIRLVVASCKGIRFPFAIIRCVAVFTFEVGLEVSHGIKCDQIYVYQHWD